jgi:hypothetical protein
MQRTIKKNATACRETRAEKKPPGEKGDDWHCKPDATEGVPASAVENQKGFTHPRAKSAMMVVV